jgi:FAD:protein FMN transferase
MDLMMPSKQSALKPKFSFTAIGTQWSINTSKSLDDSTIKQINQLIGVFDKTFSRFISDSFVSHIAKNPGTHSMPPHCREMLQLYHSIYKMTDGAFTPLIGNLMAETGYDASYSLEPKTLHQTPAWEDVLSYNQHQINLKQPIILDFGAIGKGYLVDLVASKLRAQGYSDFVINAGGDILTSISTEVALENPRNFSEAIGSIKLNGQALCGSATTRRTWGDFNHIMNPLTQQSVKTITATWVIATSTAIADGLSTALFLTNPDSLQIYDFDYAILFSDGSLSYSKQFEGCFFE